MMEKNLKRIFIYLLFLGIVSTITFYFLSNFSGGIEWGKVVNFFLVNPWGLLGIVSLLFSWLTDTLITYILVRKLILVPFSFMKSFNMSIIGIFFNKLSPASTGGSVFQIAYLKRNGVNFGSSISITELRYIIKQGAMVVAAAIGFVMALPIIQRDEITFTLALVGFGLSIGGITILILINVSSKVRTSLLGLTKWAINLLRFSKRLSPKIPDLNQKAEKEFKNYVQSMGMISKNWKFIIPVFFLALLSALGHLFLAFAAVQSFGIFENIPKGILDVISLQAVATTIIFLSPTPGSAGIAEGGFYLFFSTIIPPKFLATVTLEWRILSYFVPFALSGLIFLIIFFHRMVNTRK